MKIKLSIILLLVSSIALGCPDGYQPGGTASVYGNPDGCVPIQGAETAGPPRATTWIHSYTAVAWHPQIADVWAVWNVRDQQGGVDGAAKMAINACSSVMGDGCTLAMTTANGAIAVARRFDGILVVQSGENKSKAKDNVLNDCVKQKLHCTFMKAFLAKPWVEYVEGPRYDKAEYYLPVKAKGNFQRNSFGAIAWTASGKKPWSESVWASGGHTTYEAAGNEAVAQCQKDSGAECKLAQTNINGVIVVAVDDQSALRVTGEQNFGAAEKWAIDKCKDAQRKCRIAVRFDTRKSGVTVYNVANADTAK